MHNSQLKLGCSLLLSYGSPPNKSGSFASGYGSLLFQIVEVSLGGHDIDRFSNCRKFGTFILPTKELQAPRRVNDMVQQLLNIIVQL